jgi:retinol dehydrogenase-12|tara:strand:+ start:525 stop:1352 length:828 start_codon:yes stop_codon:yes gene_type:complete
MPVAVVTGASAGIGLETAKGLAKKNFDLILVSRSSKKLIAIKDELEAKYSIICDVFSYDLSLVKSNIEFHEEVVNKFRKIDVLINNAGAIFMDRTITVEGLEKTFALNHMSYFVLSNLFIESFDSIKVINVSSEAHRGIKLNLDDLQNSIGYFGWHAYKRSKLANIYLTYELARKYTDKDIIVNCLHPGLVNSDFANNNSLRYKIMSSLIKCFGISTREGALTSIYLATDENLENISGLYFDKCKPRKSSSISYNNEIGKFLWEYSNNIMKSNSK